MSEHRTNVNFCIGLLIYNKQETFSNLKKILWFPGREMVLHRIEERGREDPEDEGPEWPGSATRGRRWQSLGVRESGIWDVQAAA